MPSVKYLKEDSIPLSNLWQNSACFPLNKKVAITFNITYYRINSISLHSIEWWNYS